MSEVYSQPCKECGRGLWGTQPQFAKNPYCPTCTANGCGTPPAPLTEQGIKEREEAARRKEENNRLMDAYQAKRGQSDIGNSIEAVIVFAGSLALVFFAFNQIGFSGPLSGTLGFVLALVIGHRYGVRRDWLFWRSIIEDYTLICSRCKKPFTQRLPRARDRTLGGFGWEIPRAAEVYVCPECRRNQTV